MADEQSVVGRTRHGELTLDQIAELQPGLGQLMPLMSERYWICYYAAKGGNWALAAYQLNGLRSLFKKANTTRPKYKGMLDRYVKTIFDPLALYIESRNFVEFEACFMQGIELANTMHGSTNHPEIIWKLPPTPPQHLDMGPIS